MTCYVSNGQITTHSLTRAYSE